MRLTGEKKCFFFIRVVEPCYQYKNSAFSLGIFWKKVVNNSVRSVFCAKTGVVKTSSEAWGRG